MRAKLPVIMTVAAGSVVAYKVMQKVRAERRQRAVSCAINGGDFEIEGARGLPGTAQGSDAYAAKPPEAWASPAVVAETLDVENPGR